jgi:5-methylcytosine-specific restriction protein A
MIETASSMFEVERTYRRSDLHDEYGGQRFGGISTPQAHSIVLLISGEEGAEFGYDDEELDDGTMLYFGEGQEGDMTFERSNNRAVRDHAQKR